MPRKRPPFSHLKGKRECQNDSCAAPLAFLSLSLSSLCCWCYCRRGWYGYISMLLLLPCWLAGWFLLSLSRSLHVRPWILSNFVCRFFLGFPFPFCLTPQFHVLPFRLPRQLTNRKRKSESAESWVSGGTMRAFEPLAESSSCTTASW